MTGPTAELAGGRLLAAGLDGLRVYETATEQVVDTLPVPSPVQAAAHNRDRAAAYVVLADGSLHMCRAACERSRLEQLADAFGPVDRGFFVLSTSGRVVGVGADGTVTVFDPNTLAIQTCQTQAPPPAGPAVDPARDAWYYADREITAYGGISLTPGG